MLFTACGDKTDNTEKPPEPEKNSASIFIDPLKLVLDVHEKETLKATIKKDGELIFSPVEWKSSDTSVATVTSEGEVEAVAAGVASVTATYEGLKAECAVTVSSSGAKANLAFSEYSLEMKETQTKRLAPVVRFKGRSYTDAKYTYIVEDEGVATVSSSGVIEAKGYGKTKIVVKADWRGLTGEDAEFLTKELVLDVKDNINAAIEDNTYVVYQKETVIEGERFSNTADLEYSLKWGEGDITDKSKIVWYCDNESVLRVENGKIYGVSAGDANVYFSYESEKGDIYESNTVAVKVVFPVVDKTKTISLTIDKETVLTGQEVFGTEVAIEYIECDGVSVSTEEPGKIDFEKVENGKKTITVYNDSYGYRVEAYVCTKVLRTVADLKALQYKGTNIGSGNLYVLGNDIDASGTAFEGGATGWSQNSGFQGEIDGRGHKILNVTAGRGGMFGTLARAKIHDIVFEGVTLKGELRTGLLAATCYNSTLENLTVNYAQINIPIEPISGKNDECGLLIARQTTTSSTLRNITLNAKGLTVPCVLGYEIGEAVYINIVVNADEVQFIGSNQQWSANATEMDLPGGVVINEGVKL